MRVEVKSTDRIGISQEILAKFADRQWDIRAVEVSTCFTYVHIDEDNLSLTEVKDALTNLAGIEHCHQIDDLPAERRANHLQALLARIPDPIIDIDRHGVILAVNKAAKLLLLTQNSPIEGQLIDDFLQQKVIGIITDKPLSVELTFAEQAYIADISPVMANEKLSGAVIILRTMKSMGRQIALMQESNEHGIDNIIAHSKIMQDVLAQTLRFAKLEMSVFISGETGTGKELFARALHDVSPRAKAPFLAINCAALPENLLESELFGYAAGAFTGAQRGGKPGLFELANGGTVFLDEIAEMSVYLQAKLLRFLQDYRYRRVGGTKELLANVRIVSASHQNLSIRVEQQLFREDLFYRINVLNINLPPLRDRKEDIPTLCQYFIEKAALQTSQNTPAIDADAMATLLAYQWPGNIRQLQNILFRVIALTNKALITQADIELVLTEFGLPLVATDQEKSVAIENWSSAQARFEAAMLKQLYPLYPTTRRLAERLGVSHNKIAMKLREHGLT